MAKRYTGADITPWKLVDYSGKILRDAKGRPLQGYNGYKQAKEAGFGYKVAVPVRQ